MSVPEMEIRPSSCSYGLHGVSYGDNKRKRVKKVREWFDPLIRESVKLLEKFVGCLQCGCLSPNFSRLINVSRLMIKV